MTGSRAMDRKIGRSWHGVSLPFDFAFEIKRAFPDCRAGGASVHPDDRPLLLGKRIGPIEDETASVAQIEFGGGPRGIAFRPPIRSEILEVVPPDGMGRNLDGLHRLDIKWRIGRRRQGDDCLPQSVQSEKELNFTPSNHRPNDLHCSRATGTLVRIFAPDLHDEIPPEGAEEAAASRFRGRKDEERFRWIGRRTLRSLRICHFGSQSSRLRRQSPALVRIKPVVADRLLVLRRDVLHGRGEEVHGLEDLEVALRVPAPLGSVDDLAGRFVPGDFFQRERGSEQVLRQSFPSFDIVRRDRFFPGIEAEAAVGPSEELAELAFADELFLAQPGEESVAKNLG
jgi:hypothetical protein